MKKNELVKLIELDRKFKEDCERVAAILEGIKDKGNYICFAHTFRIEDGEVYWEGDEWGSYQYHEEHDGYFPLEYLTMSNEELEKIVEERNTELQREIEKKEKEKNAWDRKAKLELYEKLKKELGI